MPPLAAILADARLKAIHEGSAARLPPPRAKEILLELPILVAAYDAHANEVREHRLLTQPLPDGLTVIEYQHELSAVHGLTDSLSDAEKVAAALTRLVQYISRAERAHLSDALAELVERNYRAEGESLRQLGEVLTGIEAALRVRRLERAVAALGGNASAAERLLAAHTWQEDNTQLEAFRKKYKNSLKLKGPAGLAELNDPGLPDRVHLDAEKCRALAGPLTTKVNELDLAIDFWLRGRYGEGSEVFGLAKPEIAIDDRDAARNLYMPVELPRPTDPAKWDGKAPIVPHYARRHFYWWAWENHQLASGHAFGVSGLVDSNLHLVERQATMYVPGIPYLTRHCGIGRCWTNDWTPVRFTYLTPDARTIQQGVNLKILARLVGYLEYEESLTHFQRFLAEASPEEQAAADELVRDRHELVVYTNLSRFVEPPNASNSEKPMSADDIFERRGLEWVIGLARLEHQAMLVGFTANPSPLLALLPPPRPGEAYTELLVDGARMHYWAWRKARDQAKGSLPEGPDLISEARRAALICEFLQAAQARAGGALGDMGRWQQEVERYLAEVTNRIRSDNELLQLAILDAPRVVAAAAGAARANFDDLDDER